MIPSSSSHLNGKATICGASLALCIITVVSSSVLQPLAAYALQKVFELRLQRVEFVTPPFPQPFALCGETSTFHADILLRNFHFILYNDSSFLITATSLTQILDSSGTLIASETGTQLISTGILTQQNQFNTVEHCVAPTPGLSSNFHFGYTVGVDGSIQEVHLVSHS